MPPTTNPVSAHATKRTNCTVSTRLDIVQWAGPTSSEQLTTTVSFIAPQGSSFVFKGLLLSAYAWTLDGYLEFFQQYLKQLAKNTASQAARIAVTTIAPVPHEH